MKKLLIAAAFSLLFSACHKDDDTNNTTPPATVPGKPAGYLAAEVVSGFGGSTEQATAYFFQDTLSTMPDSVHTVAINTVPLEYDDLSSHAYWTDNYSAFKPLQLTAGVTWVITGRGTIPSFTYTSPASFPVYSGAVPDSFSKTSGLTLTFDAATVQGADSVLVTLEQGLNATTTYYSPTAGTFTIPAGTMTNISAGNYALVSIEPVSNDYPVFGSRKYLFLLGRKYNYHVFVR